MLEQIYATLQPAAPMPPPDITAITVEQHTAKPGQPSCQRQKPHPAHRRERNMRQPGYREGRPTSPGQAQPPSHPNVGTRHAPPLHPPDHSPVPGQGPEPQKVASEEGHHKRAKTLSPKPINPHDPIPSPDPDQNTRSFSQPPTTDSKQRTGM
ncbi:hypothetical protein CRENBAI_026724 [Crenichthys baileyi]|uniref:Uncharacterized protein n=1 Tax=Crenichthys baileyi TaxID=28760 RepID=A0AAV9SFV0_9TELE